MLAMNLAANSYLLPRVVDGLDLRHRDCDRDGARIDSEAQLPPHHLTQTVVGGYRPDAGVGRLHPDNPQ